MQSYGIGHDLVLTLLSEIGVDFPSHFPGAKNFTSWLCLCPNKKVSGGKVLSSKTRKSKNRLRQAFRQAAVGIAKRKDGNPLTAFYWRIAARNGKGAAITATARKLATIVYHMVKNNQPFDPELILHDQHKARNHKIKKIQKIIEKLEVKPDELVFA